MIGLRPGIASYARAAYLRELHGDTSGAIGAMELAASSGLVGHEDRSWALYQLGQLYLSKDETDTAEVIFRGILDEHSGYPYAMGGLARVNLVRGRYEEALNLFNEAYARMPADAFLEGKLELYRLMGDEEEIAQTTAELERSFRSAEEIGENVRMEYADFLADMNQNLDTALELAAAEYHRRPDHLHALETYAWVLHKKGRSEEAIPYIERAMRLDSGDAMVHFRAGLIYESAARDSEAHFHLKKALDSNLHIESLSAAAEARERLG
jgi:tetratricopeptide (TPR) repeat protein